VNTANALLVPYRGVLPQAAVASIDEQLSGACTVEIAAFDEFSKLLGNPATTTGFDHVVFDTAPTGTPCGCSRSMFATVGGLYLTLRRAILPKLEAQQRLLTGSHGESLLKEMWLGPAQESRHLPRISRIRGITRIRNHG
jgi:hypothetical protein